MLVLIVAERVIVFFYFEKQKDLLKFLLKPYWIHDFHAFLSFQWLCDCIWLYRSLDLEKPENLLKLLHKPWWISDFGGLPKSLFMSVSIVSVIILSILFFDSQKPGDLLKFWRWSIALVTSSIQNHLKSEVFYSSNFIPFKYQKGQDVYCCLPKKGKIRHFHQLPSFDYKSEMANCHWLWKIMNLLLNVRT